VENSFGILGNQFRVLRAPLCLNMKNCANVIKACVVLHNFLLAESSTYIQPGDFVEDSDGLPIFTDDHDGMEALGQLEGNRSGNFAARKQRECLTDYFWNDGAVEFQWEKVFG